MNDDRKQPRPYDAVLGGNSPPQLIADILEEIKQLKQKPSWTLVYAHDDFGDRTDGDINLLIDAVRNGCRIRLVIEMKNYEYAINADNLWIKNSIVYAQNTSAVSASFKGDRLMFLDESYHFMSIVSTQGDREVIRWNVGEHKKREGVAHNKVAVKWFSD